MSTETGTTEAQSGAVFGLDDNIAAVLAYIVPLFAIVVLVTEENNQFVRFHSAQALLGVVALYVGGFVLGIALGNLGLGFVASLLYLGSFLVSVFLAYKAYEGETFELPVVGEYARQVA